jgi:hypothetical protein
VPRRIVAHDETGCSDWRRGDDRELVRSRSPDHPRQTVREPTLSLFLTTLSFPASLMISMPFTFMKGQPWKAQVVIIGTTLSILVVISSLAATGATRL